MPIYEYQCKDCGHRLEALQKISDAPLQDCPACATAGLDRLVSASSFRLKGGGWYETDFKTGSKRHGTAAESPTASSAAGGAASATPASPASSSPAATAD